MDWNAVGAISGVIAAALGVGALFGRGLRKVVDRRSAAIRELRAEMERMRSSMADVSSGVTKISETLTGREPTPLEPEPPMGLIGVVLHHGDLLTKLQAWAWGNDAKEAQ